MNKNVAKREYNAIKKLIEDREKFADKHAKLEWDEARRKALRKKRADIRRLEKEAKQSSKPADKPAKKPRIGPGSRTKKQDDRSTAASSTALNPAASAVRSLFQTSFGIDPDPESDPTPLPTDTVEQVVLQGQDEEEQDQEDIDEIINPRPSTSRSQPAPAAGKLPVTPRRRRQYLPDTNIESRFGVILTELKDIWKELNAIKKDNERELAVNFVICFVPILTVC